MLVCRVFFSNAPSRPRSRHLCNDFVDDVGPLLEVLGAQGKALPALEFGQEADDVVAQLVGLDTLDTDVFLQVGVYLWSKLEEGATFGDGKAG